MANRSPIIGEFRNLLGVAEIVGVGGIRYPRSGAQEAEAEVLMGLDMDARGFDANNDTRSCWVGCGQLDLFVPGTLWKSGKRIGSAASKSFIREFVFVKDENLGIGGYSQPARSRPFPTQRIANAPGFLLDVPGAGIKGKAGNVMPERFLLPKIELIRSLFGVSNGFLLELFDGLRNPAVSRERGLVSRHLSSIKEDGTVVVRAGRRLTDDEALVVAAVFADPVIRKLHDQVFQQLSVNPEWRSGRPVYPDISWPWEQPVSIKLEARWVLRVKAGFRLVVSRIIGIRVPLPFTRVEVHHPGAVDKIDLDGPIVQGRMRNSNALRAILTTGDAASPSRHPIKVNTGTDGAIEASGIDVVHVEVGGSVRAANGIIGEDRRDEASFGTGGRQPGADVEVGAAKLRRGPLQDDERPARSLFESLQATWKALEAACVERGWNLTALPRSDSGSNGALYGGLDLPREPLVAQVKSDHGRVLVVDRGSPAGDEVSLGILTPRDTAMSERAMAISARKTCDAVGGRWRSPKCKTEDFNVKSVNRSENVWQDENAFKDMLVRRLTATFETGRS